MRTAAPLLPGSSHTLESPVDRALSLLFAQEPEAALRWAAAIVKQDPTMPTALLVTGRLLGQLGRQEVGREACAIAVARSIDLENLPLAVAAAREVERLGGDAARHLDEIAAAFCRDSARLGEGMPPPPPLPPAESFQPLAAVLTGAALLNKATEIAHDANRLLAAETSRPGIASLPLFSRLSNEGLRALVATLLPVWLAEDVCVIEQGSEGTEAYFVARGELLAQRERDGRPFVLARLTNGAIFGEMALLSRAPRAGSVVTTRPSIVVRAEKDALDAVAEAHAEVGAELSAYGRDRMVQNLVRMSELFELVKDDGRAALVASCKTRVFEKGDRLLTRGEAAPGVYILASGEVSVVAVDAASGDALVEGSLGPGEVVGEDALVLRRPVDADVVAVHATVTLFLPAEAFHQVIEEHPTVLWGLYKLAVRRDVESVAIQQEEASVVDDFVVLSR
jgi:CRP-like cAMP-binding protein